ncbi:MAG: hypothetical protein ABSB59_31805 [Streptosporangiaceae bacterium]|jgi:hypothetical protein
MPYGPSPRDSPPLSRREARAKRSRIMVELTRADYEVLNRWRARADEELDQPAGETTLAGAISAMIRVAAADRVVNDAVLALMRAEQS